MKKKANDFCSCCCHSYVGTAIKMGSKLSAYTVLANSGATKMAETSTATEAAARVVTKSGLRALAKKTVALSAVIEGTSAVISSYNKKQEAISSLQEGDSDNIEKQVKRVENEFKKEVVGHTMSAAGAVGGTTAGAVVGSLFCPGLGTFVGGALGNIVGEYLGSKTGETVGGAMYDSDEE